MLNPDLNDENRNPNLPAIGIVAKARSASSPGRAASLVTAQSPKPSLVALNQLHSILPETVPPAPEECRIINADAIRTQENSATIGPENSARKGAGELAAVESAISAKLDKNKAAIEACMVQFSTAYQEMGKAIDSFRTLLLRQLKITRAEAMASNLFNDYFLPLTLVNSPILLVFTVSQLAEFVEECRKPQYADFFSDQQFVQQQATFSKAVEKGERNPYIKPDDYGFPFALLVIFVLGFEDLNKQLKRKEVLKEDGGINVDEDEIQSLNVKLIALRKRYVNVKAHFIKKKKIQFENTLITPIYGPAPVPVQSAVEPSGAGGSDADAKSGGDASGNQHKSGNGRTGDSDKDDDDDADDTVDGDDNQQAVILKSRKKKLNYDNFCFAANDGFEWKNDDVDEWFEDKILAGEFTLDWPELDVQVRFSPQTLTSLVTRNDFNATMAFLIVGLNECYEEFFVFLRYNVPLLGQLHTIALLVTNRDKKSTNANDDDVPGFAKEVLRVLNRNWSSLLGKEQWRTSTSFVMQSDDLDKGAESLRKTVYICTRRPELSREEIEKRQKHIAEKFQTAAGTVDQVLGNQNHAGGCGDGIPMAQISVLELFSHMVPEYKVDCCLEVGPGHYPRLAVLASFVTGTLTLAYEPYSNVYDPFKDYIKGRYKNHPDHVRWEYQAACARFAAQGEVKHIRKAKLDARIRLGDGSAPSHTTRDAVFEDGEPSSDMEKLDDEGKDDSDFDDSDPDEEEEDSDDDSDDGEENGDDDIESSKPRKKKRVQLPSGGNDKQKKLKA